MLHSTEQLKQSELKRKERKLLLSKCVHISFSHIAKRIQITTMTDSISKRQCGVKNPINF